MFVRFNGLRAFGCRDPVSVRRSVFKISALRIAIRDSQSDVGVHVRVRCRCDARMNIQQSG